MNIPHLLLSKLERSLDLDAAERAALSAMPLHEVEVRADHEILREGDRPRQCFLIVEGLTCVSQMVEGGRRQIDSFHIPGDMPDLHGLHLAEMDCDMWAITECRLAFMDHSAIRQLCAEQPRIAAALWRCTVVDAAIYRQWVTNLGQRPAINRLAHLFCEMMLRMDAVGRAKDGSCALPITQTDLSDASGLSFVHVNRTLQDLRGEGLITFGRGQLTIHDWEALALLADFRPGYLHLGRRARGQSDTSGPSLPGKSTNGWPSSQGVVRHQTPSDGVDRTDRSDPRSGPARASDREEQP
jgi:CRP-like cAMP-binding protein